MVFILRRRDFTALGTMVLAAATTNPLQAQSGMTSLDNDLRPYLRRFELPAVAAGGIKDGRLLAAAGAGAFVLRRVLGGPSRRATDGV